MYSPTIVDSFSLVVPALAILSLALAAALLVVTMGTRGRLSALQDKVAEAEALRHKLGKLEEEQRFLSWFTREFPHFMWVIHGQLRVRKIPEAIHNFVQRSFEPGESVVLVRRKPVRSDPARENELIVAASSARSYRPGTVVPLDRGELAHVARGRRSMTGDEISRLVQLEERGETDLPLFQPDLAAPMVVGDSILGVVAIRDPGRRHPRGKNLLDLISQTGALALSNAAALSQVRSAADADPLTGIYNKGALNFRLAKLLSLAAEQHSELSIFIFDLDHFKNYNDQNGHLAGDQLLKTLANLVSEVVRTDDVFGRFGGEEFLLLLPDRDLEEAAFVAGKIRQLIEQQDFPFGESQPGGRISVSGGIASFPEHGRTPAEILRAADAALYRAKQAGRNRVSRALSAAVGEEKPVVAPAAGEAAEQDDLELIRGIGPSYAEGLRTMGINSYRQVAKLDWTEMNMVAMELGTRPERIIHDRWMQQARSLHREHHGESI